MKGHADLLCLDLGTLLKEYYFHFIVPKTINILTLFFNVNIKQSEINK